MLIARKELEIGERRAIGKGAGANSRDVVREERENERIAVGKRERADFAQRFG